MDIEESKQPETGQGFLNFVFGALAIFIHLELNFPELIEKHLNEIGNSWLITPKPLSKVIASLIFTATSIIAIWIYKKIWWPCWSAYNSRRGQWLYGLVDERSNSNDDSKVLIFGKFYLDHKVDSVKIFEAKAYYVTADGQKIEKFRAHWEADDIVIKKNLIKIDYLVKNAQASNKHFTPIKYEGRMTLKEKNDSDLIIGTNKFDGHIVDLSMYDDFSGWIYCERLNFWQTRKFKKEEKKVNDQNFDYLNKLVPRFIKRAKSMTPSIKEEIKKKQNVIQYESDKAE